ncbi:MAG: hypothetical protein MUE51_05635 [Thermoleophilia bacterium]|jgi:hypothetical protein|nr:hypothetical protein [Thermoleophilia bacterium]
MNSHSTQDQGAGEARERVVREVTADQAPIFRAQGSSPARDPSSRRGFGAAALVAAGALAVVLAIAGAVIGGVLAGPPGLAGGVACGLVVGGALGLLSAAASEDGRVERARRRPGPTGGRT